MDFPPITLEPCIGRKKGVLVSEPLDWIVAHHPRKGAIRIGSVWRYDGATVHLTKWFKPEVREHIYRVVVELRKQTTDAQVAERLSSIPDPRLIAAYLAGGQRRKRRSTVPAGASERQNDGRKRLYVPGRD